MRTVFATFKDGTILEVSSPVLGNADVNKRFVLNIAYEVGIDSKLVDFTERQEPNKARKRGGPKKIKHQPDVPVS